MQNSQLDLKSELAGGASPSGGSKTVRISQDANEDVETGVLDSLEKLVDQFKEVFAKHES